MKKNEINEAFLGHVKKVCPNYKTLPKKTKQALKMMFMRGHMVGHTMYIVALGELVKDEITVEELMKELLETAETIVEWINNQLEEQKGKR